MKNIYQKIKLITKNKYKYILYFYNKNIKNTNNKIIIILSEIYGINNDIKEICKKIYKNNYIVIAINFFYKIEKYIKTETNINKIRKIVNNTINDKLAIKIINQTIKWIKKKYKKPQIALMGLSWGARIALLFPYYNKNKDIKTIVSLYGRLKNNKNSNQPKQPYEIIKYIKIPVLCIYGDKDEIIKIEDIKKFKEKIKIKKNIKLIIFKNIKHSFLSKYTINYNNKIYLITFNHILNWFKKKI